MAKRSPQQSYILAPFTVVRDTREQHPYHFTGFKADSRHKGKDLVIPIEDAALATGDYSIRGLEAEIAIERKSENDLFGTLLQGRDRFTRELERMAAMRWCAVVIESDWASILGLGARAAGVSPPIAPTEPIDPYALDGSSTNSATLNVRSPHAAKTVYRSILAFSQRHPNVHWFVLGSRALAERTTYRLLERYWLDREERIQQAAIEAARGAQGVTATHISPQEVDI